MSPNLSVLADIILPNGEVVPVMLPSNVEPRLRELQKIVGGYIETVHLSGDRCMVFNENGKDAPHMINNTATNIAHEAQSIMPSDYIAGVAVVLPNEVLQ